MKIKEKVKVLLIISIIVCLFNNNLSGIQNNGYGDFMSLDLWVRYQHMKKDFYRMIEERDHKQALEYAKEFLPTCPEVEHGHFLTFMAGVLKKDFKLINKGLVQLTDKYVVMPKLYSYINWIANIYKDNKNENEFNDKIKIAVNRFFDKREKYLKKKLKKNINTKAILKELTLINDQIGDEDDFLVYVKSLMETDYYFTRFFSSKRKDPKDMRFKKLRESVDKKWKSWTGSTEEKIRGLLLVASEMRLWNASLDFANISDWNTFVASYIPKILSSSTKLEYYEVIANIVNKVGEDHTGIRFPKDVSSTFSNCGISTIYADGKFLVKEVKHDYLKGKIHVGDEIVSVNNLSVKDYLNKYRNKYPFIMWSNAPEKIHFYFKAAKLLLKGKKDSKVLVDLKKPDGNVYQMKLIHDSYKKKNIKKKNEKLVELKVMKDNIYYIKIKRFWGSDIYKDFLAVLKGHDTSKIKGVVFDLRDNGGGNSGYGDRIFSHFIQKPKNNYVFNYYPVRNVRRMSTDALGYVSMKKGGFPIKPSKTQKILSPVVVLINPGTGSAAEDFTFLFKYHKRGIVVGLPSGGGTGMGHPVKLPGGGLMRVCVNIDTYFSWIGIQPDHTIDFTPNDLRNDKDPYIKKALKLMGEM